MNKIFFIFLLILSLNNPSSTNSPTNSPATENLASQRPQLSVDQLLKDLKEFEEDETKKQRELIENNLNLAFTQIKNNFGKITIFILLAGAIIFGGKKLKNRQVFKADYQEKVLPFHTQQPQTPRPTDNNHATYKELLLCKFHEIHNDLDQFAIKQIRSEFVNESISKTHQSGCENFLANIPDGIMNKLILQKCQNCKEIDSYQKAYNFFTEDQDYLSFNEAFNLLINYFSPAQTFNQEFDITWLNKALGLIGHVKEKKDGLTKHLCNKMIEKPAEPKPYDMIHDRFKELTEKLEPILTNLKTLITKLIQNAQSQQQLFTEETSAREKIVQKENQVFTTELNNLNTQLEPKKLKIAREKLQAKFNKNTPTESTPQANQSNQPAATTKTPEEQARENQLEKQRIQQREAAAQAAEARFKLNSNKN